MECSYKTLPSFRRRQHEPAEYLYEGSDADVYRNQKEVGITLGSNGWNRELEELITRYEVNRLSVRQSHVCRRLFEFLLQHRPLRRLSFLLYEPIDLRPVLCLPQLRDLYIKWKPEEPPAYEMDFTKLSLERCELQLFPQFESILDCSTVCSLSANFDHFINTKSADCSRLPQLCDLSISGPAKLERFQIHPNAELTALKISSCSQLSVDWSRVGRDLIHLSIAGRIGFPIADIRAARKLRTLMLSEMQKIDLENLSFLLELPSLNAIDVFPATMLSTESDRMVRNINEAGGHGPELITKVGTYEQDLVRSR